MTDDFIVGAAAVLTSDRFVALRPNYSPDGSLLVFEIKRDARSDLYVTRSDGTHGRPIGSCNRAATRVQGRAAFVTARHFAYVSDRGGQFAIWLCDIKRDEVRQLTQPGPDEDDFGPSAISGTTCPILFLRTNHRSESNALYQIGQQRDESAIKLAPWTGDQPWWLDDAQDFVFHAHLGTEDVICRDTARGLGNLETIGPRDLATSYVTPFPSPDGRHVAFSHAVHGVPQIGVMRIDGTHLQQVTQGDIPALFPTWSPSGDQLAYVQGDPFADSPTGQVMAIPLLAAQT